jgi:sigma-B regulation protein RsbU (phosphoserine phosphatase)
MRSVHSGNGGNTGGDAGEHRIHVSELSTGTGDVLVAYTDGITETENPSEDMWGQERLRNLLCGSYGDTPQQIIRQIVDELSVFAKTKPQRDDMTVLVAWVRNDS